MFPFAAFLILAVLNFTVFLADAANFTASLDRDTITLGESATLSLAFEGGQSRNVPTPNVPGLQIVQTGTSQNVSFVNGAMSSDRHGHVFRDGAAGGRIHHSRADRRCERTTARQPAIEIDRARGRPRRPPPP